LTTSNGYFKLVSQLCDKIQKVKMKILRQDTARTQKNLLVAASEIFAEKGFRDTTIAEISKRAKTNVAAINYHFGDKETLYREAWRHSFRESIKTYPPDGGVDTNATPEHRLVGQVTALLRRITDNGNIEFSIAHQELAKPTGLLEEVMHEEFEPLQQRTESLVREILSPYNSEMQVRFCAISIISQCVLPSFINRIEKWEKNAKEDSWRVNNIEGYAEHVVGFSLAGMSAIRQKAR
jgi:TetR/AcrR family transcriptional regulator, regulator of cefoperazone and chloramphenicol sensitivity